MAKRLELLRDGRLFDVSADPYNHSSIELIRVILSALHYTSGEAYGKCCVVNSLSRKTFFATLFTSMQQNVFASLFTSMYKN